VITTKDLTDPIGKQFQWAAHGDHGCSEYGCWDTRVWFDVDCINTRVAGWLFKRVECEVQPQNGSPWWVRRDRLREPLPDHSWEAGIRRARENAALATKKKGKK
jgi:hypothetical protein